MAEVIRDPLDHTRRIKEMLRDAMDHIRSDIDKIDEPQAKAMFETSAEVLGGLIKTFEDYERKSEPAWQEGVPQHHPVGG